MLHGHKVLKKVKHNITLDVQVDDLSKRNHNCKIEINTLLF